MFFHGSSTKTSTDLCLYSPPSTNLGPSRVHTPSYRLGIGDPIPLPTCIAQTDVLSGGHPCASERKPQCLVFTSLGNLIVSTVDPASIGRKPAQPTQGQAGVISGSRMVDCLVGVLIYHCIHHLRRVEKSVSRQGTVRPQEATFHVLWNSCKVRLKFSCTRMHSIRRSDALQKTASG